MTSVHRRDIALRYPAFTIALRTLTVLYFAISAVTVAGRAQQPAPDATVWGGAFTDAQAARGRGHYAAHCANCHGPALQGAESKALSGARFWTDWQGTTVDYLLSQISRNMPFTDDGSLAGTLGDRVYADIVAHILQSNGFPAGDRELSMVSGRGVRIVQKDGATELPNGATARIAGCLARTEKGEWQLVRASAPARVVIGEAPPDLPLGDRTITLRFVLTSLQKYVGHRMTATGILMGEGGRDGLNVSEISSLAPTCD